MTSLRFFMLTCVLCIHGGSVVSAKEPSKTKILLVAGETAKIDKMGHHDYLAGSECLKILLSQTDGVDAVRINNGWPSDEAVFDGSAAVVFYCDGGGKQAFLNSPARIAKMQKLIDAGVGVVMIHQAVDYPDEFADQATNWLGGIYRSEKSGRGHWDSEHADFPSHPITRGVTPWKINDGWLNGIQFVDDMKGITPLVWSGKEYVASRPGVQSHIVGWTYERRGGGRSFSFTGLDAHSAWEKTGLRQLMVNGILWSAGVKIPAAGAPCDIEPQALEAILTPRTPKPKKPAKTPKNSANKTATAK